MIPSPLHPATLLSWLCLPFLLCACGKNAEAPADTDPQTAAAALTPAQPPSPPYPHGTESPPRPKRNLRKEYVEFQAAWDKAVAAGDPEAFKAVRDRVVDPKTQGLLSSWENMEEGVAGDMSFGRDPFDLCVEHGLAPWRTVVADMEKPVQVQPGGILVLKLSDGFVTPEGGGSSSNGEAGKYSVGTPQLGSWPGLSLGSNSGWFLGTDKETGEKKPFNFFSVSMLFFIPADLKPGEVKQTVRLPWKKPVATGLENAETTQELTLAFGPSPKPDNETLLSLWDFGVKLGTDLSKEDPAAKKAAESESKPGDAAGKLKMGLPVLAWADRLMQQFSTHPDATVRKMAGSLAARSDWQNFVVKGYDPEVVAKMENLLQATAELQDTAAPSPAAKVPDTTSPDTKANP